MYLFWVILFVMCCNWVRSYSRTNSTHGQILVKEFNWVSLRVNRVKCMEWTLLPFASFNYHSKHSCKNSAGNLLNFCSTDQAKKCFCLHFHVAYHCMQLAQCRGILIWILTINFAIVLQVKNLKTSIVHRVALNERIDDRWYLIILVLDVVYKLSQLECMNKLNLRISWSLKLLTMVRSNDVIAMNAVCWMKH